MIIRPSIIMTRLASTLARALPVLGLLPSLACSSVTIVTAEAPMQIQAQPPAPPLPNLPPVPQPPPPPRVTLDGDLLVLDEALTFDETDRLASEHQDIIAELAKWLATHDEVLELTIEAQSIGEGQKRVQQKRSKALAQQLVDALVAEGIAAERVIAVGLGKSPDEQRHVTLRISKRAEPPQPAETETETEEAQP